MANWQAYAASLVHDIHSALKKDPATLALFRTTVTHDMERQVADAGGEIADGVVGGLVEFLLKRYHNMRGREFAQKLMSNIRSISVAAQTNSLRNGLAAATTAAVAAVKKRKAGEGAEVEDPEEEEMREAEIVALQQLDALELEYRDDPDLHSEEPDDA